MKNQLFAIMACTLLFASCKKDINETPAIPDDVYVAGVQWDSTTGYDISAVWKNGTLSLNTLGANKSHYAYAMAVSGTDVFTTGYENAGPVLKCHVWKNGQHQYELGDISTVGYGIAVSGTDVYVAGYSYESTPHTYYARQWLNSGSGVTTLATSTNAAIGRCIAISGTDTYVGGREGNQAKVWKNGIPMTLNNNTDCDILCMVIEGNDIYAAGYSHYPFRIRYWKNGNNTDIPTSNESYANAIAVKNGDVYIAGNETIAGKAVAKYWKNGNATTLGDGIRNARANGIAVKGNDVYVCGEIQGAANISDYATIWKNGQATTIGLQNSRASAIVVQ